MAEHFTRNIRFCLLSSIGFFGIALLLLKSHKGLILRRTFYSLLLYVCISTQHFKSYNALKRKMNPIQLYFIEKINTLNRELQPSYGLEFIFMQQMFCLCIPESLKLPLVPTTHKFQDVKDFSPFRALPRMKNLVKIDIINPYIKNVCSTF